MAAIWKLAHRPSRLAARLALPRNLSSEEVRSEPTEGTAQPLNWKPIPLKPGLPLRHARNRCRALNAAGRLGGRRRAGSAGFGPSPTLCCWSALGLLVCHDSAVLGRLEPCAECRQK